MFENAGWRYMILSVCIPMCGVKHSPVEDVRFIMTPSKEFGHIALHMSVC